MCGCNNNKTDLQKIVSRNAVLLEFEKFESINQYDLHVYGIQRVKKIEVSNLISQLMRKTNLKKIIFLLKSEKTENLLLLLGMFVLK